MLQTLILLSLSFGSKDSVSTSVSHGVTVELPPLLCGRILSKVPKDFFIAGGTGHFS